MLLLLTAIQSLIAQEYAERFERISLESDLSHGTVYAMLQDSTGFLWLGTEGGLNRFDGYEFTTYFHDPKDSTSLSNGNISAMIQDPDGYLWLATWGGGLEKFDPRTERFTHFRNIPGDPNSLSDDRVQVLHLDRAGSLWVGTYAGGLNRLNRSTGKFERFANHPSDVRSISNNRVWAFLEDSVFLYVGTTDGLNRVRIDRPENGFERFFSEPGNPATLSNSFVRCFLKDRSGELWIGTQFGLNLFNPYTAKSRRFLPAGIGQAGLSQGVINVLAQDPWGDLWIGTVEGGLNRYTPATGKWKHFVNVENQVHSLSHNDVRSILLDASQNLWVATRGGGINKMDLKPVKFKTYVNEPTNPNSLVDNRVWNVFEERSGDILWIGTEKGLSRLDKQTGFYTNWINVPGNRNSLSSNSVRSVVVEPGGLVWVATSGGGLNRFDPKSGTWKAYMFDPSRPGTIADNRIRSLYLDSLGTLWAGTFRGLSRLAAGSEIFTTLKHDPSDSNSLTHNEIRCVVPDSGGTLWIGTYGGGVNFYNPVTGAIRAYRADPNRGTGLSSNDIVCLAVDRRRGLIWIGTDGSGLNCLDPRTGRTKIISTDDGLPNNTIQGIVIDGSGNIWVSTNRGISRYSPQFSDDGVDFKATGAFRNYDVRDGLQGNFFVAGAAHRGRTGTIYFGGIGGLNSFNPSGIKDNANVPTVVITHFKKFDRRVSFEQSTPFVEAVTLSHSDNFFAIEFSSLDFTKPSKNRFAYQLEGFDRDWNVVVDRHEASYTNVDPGTYTFRVIGTNNDGVWNAVGASLEITIVPPFWRMPWFVTLLAALGVVIAGSAYRFRVQSIERQRSKLQEEVDLRTQELQRSRDEMARINEIVQIINAEHDFDSMLESMLAITRHIQDVEKAAALIYDRPISGFRFVASAGHSMNDLAGVRLTSEEAEARYLSRSELIHEDIYVARDAPSLPHGDKFARDVIPKAMLILRVRLEGETLGYLIFDCMNNPDAFRRENLGLMISLKEHFISAFVKTQITEELRLLNDKKNEFLGIAAHDLRSPLSMMIGYLRISLEDLEHGLFDKVQAKQDLGTILRIAENMNQLISELLDISAIESGKVALELQPVRLSDILLERENIHRRSAIAKQIDLDVKLNTLDMTVHADASRLCDVVDNLVLNALKYTHSGGRIVVYGERRGEEAIVHVRDDGQGLSEDDLRHVFTSFKRLSAKPTAGEASTGLGLAIVKKVVEMHGGRVWVESAKDHGSCFSFALPLRST